jgi:hypothetical protein
MKRLVRWLRGALGIGVTWSVLWILIGIVLATALRVVRPQDFDPGEGMTTVLPLLGVVGLLSGLAFAGLLSVTERRRSLRELSLPRVALWGALGSAAIPWLMGADGSMGWLTGVLGATFASASVAIARRGASEALSPGDTAAAEMGGQALTSPPTR